MPDLSVFGKFKTPQDYERENRKRMLEEQALQAKLQFGGDNAPAAVKIANEFQKARIAGDTQRMNDLLVAGKMLDKGLLMDEEGIAMQIPGYADARGGIKYGESRGSEQGKSDVELVMQPQIEGAKKKSSEIGKEFGADVSLLADLESKMPQLYATVDRLGELSDVATYTLAGQGKDFLRRQAGLEMGEGALARAEYTSLIDNQILPLLRQTFGAQFTQKEGESLKQTLGDVNKSPEEKKRVLKSFIEQKIQNIQSAQRKINAYEQGGIPPILDETPQAPIKRDLYGQSKKAFEEKKKGKTQVRIKFDQNGNIIQ